jgi:membrane-associated phospholipid phosphatase
MAVGAVPVPVPVPSGPSCYSLIHTLNHTCSITVFSATILSVLLFPYSSYYPSLLLFALTNALLGIVLKHVIASERPTHSLTHSRVKKHSLGMPSSHANALSFHTVYLSLALYDRVSEDVVTTPLLIFIYILLCILFVVYTLCVCYARVYYTHDHTRAQVCVGLVMGTLNAYIARTYLYQEFAHEYENHIVPLLLGVDK